jgi:hypothetical protein
LQFYIGLYPKVFGGKIELVMNTTYWVVSVLARNQPNGGFEQSVHGFLQSNGFALPKFHSGTGFLEAKAPDFTRPSQETIFVLREEGDTFRLSRIEKGREEEVDVGSIISPGNVGNPDETLRIEGQGKKVREWIFLCKPRPL